MHGSQEELYLCNDEISVIKQNRVSECLKTMM